jgi:hypothetical protein
MKSKNALGVTFALGLTLDRGEQNRTMGLRRGRVDREYAAAGAIVERCKDPTVTVQEAMLLHAGGSGSGASGDTSGASRVQQRLQRLQRLREARFEARFERLLEERHRLTSTELSEKCVASVPGSTW